MKRFYLIDGHGQIFRAYYAPFRVLNAPSGQPTKAVYTFTQMVLAILREKRPDYLAVALDVSDATTERRQLYPEYKAHREATPEDLGPQVEKILEILREMWIPVYRQSGQEADDIIATISERLKEEDVEITVVSRDKDLHQIVSDRVKLWDPQDNKTLDPAVMEAELGYGPEQAVEVQTLMGDTSDNVPGVPGVGPKRAVELIRRYGSVEGVLAHLDELTPKLRASFEEHRGVLELSRRLVTLRRDVPLEFTLEECRPRPLRLERLQPIFQELGFRRLLDQVEAAAGETVEPPIPAAAVASAAGRYRLVNSPEAFRELLGLLRQRRELAVDTETTSLHPVDCDLVGLSFSWQAGEGWYVALRSRRGPVLDPGPTLEALRPLLESAEVKKCGQNIKYDIVVLRGAGVELRGVTFDSMVASYVLNPERRNHSMDALARDLLGYETIPISQLIGKGREQTSLLDAGLDELTRYSGEDADITWRLKEVLRPRIEASPQRALFHDVEMPLVEVLAAMEYHGVAIDGEGLRAISARLGERIEELRQRIFAAAGREFTIDSPKQLAELLFDEHGLRSLKRTKTARSTDASVLQALAAETAHPLPALVLEYRELTKLRSTYVEPLPGMVSSRTGRLHASFHQTVAATGRLSASDPNLQNIPIRTEQGREIRKAFVPGDRDHVLITADYSQIELRILAHLSGDPELVEAFRTDQDVHAFVAAQLGGVRPEEVSPQERRRAKAVNFGIIYGQGPFGLARSLGISKGEAAEFIRQYKRRYCGIVRFIDGCIAQAEKTGEVSTMLGRRRSIPEIHSRNRTRRAQGERLAVNTVVQGSAADMIKVAMVRLGQRIRRDALDLRLLIQVHDELVFEAPREDAPRLADVVRQEMVSALPLRVPVRVDVAWGDNWLEGKG